MEWKAVSSECRECHLAGGLRVRRKVMPYTSPLRRNELKPPARLSSVYRCRICGGEYEEDEKS